MRAVQAEVGEDLVGLSLGKGAKREPTGHHGRERLLVRRTAQGRADGSPDPALKHAVFDRDDYTVPAAIGPPKRIPRRSPPNHPHLTPDAPPLQLTAPP